LVFSPNFTSYTCLKLKDLYKGIGLIFGIVPKHQSKGFEGALINEFAKRALTQVLI
jgi:hypothetical protein